MAKYRIRLQGQQRASRQPQERRPSRWMPGRPEATDATLGHIDRELINSAISRSAPLLDSLVRHLDNVTRTSNKLPDWVGSPSEHLPSHLQYIQLLHLYLVRFGGDLKIAFDAITWVQDRKTKDKDLGVDEALTIKFVDAANRLSMLVVNSNWFYASIYGGREDTAKLTATQQVVASAMNLAVTCDSRLFGSDSTLDTDIRSYLGAHYAAHNPHAVQLSGTWDLN